MKNRFPRSFYIPKGALKVSDKQSMAVAYLYDCKSGKLGAVGFQGYADKPSFHYTFKTSERRERHIRQFFAEVCERESRVRCDREKRLAFVHSAQVGDIYRTSWGYDQTNVEFFEVVEIKGKFAMLREIEAASHDDGQGAERCVPQSGAYVKGERGQPIRRLIQEGRIKICDVRTAWPWGKRGPGGIVIGDAAKRTAAGWGH